MAKYIISESQYTRLKEQLDDNDNFIEGDPNEETLLITDFLLRYDIVDPSNINVFDDSIEIYGFENVELPYFNNNMIKLNVYPSQGDIWINVETSDNEDEEDMEMKSQVFEYIKHLAEKYSIFHWALDGEPI
jgi:hypothetical protein